MLWQVHNGTGSRRQEDKQHFLFSPWKVESMHIMLEYEDILDSGQPLGEKEMKQMCGEEHKKWKEEGGTKNRKNAESKDGMSDTDVGCERVSAQAGQYS